MRKGRAAGEYVGREAINDDAWDLQQPTTDHQGLYFVAHVAVYKCFYFPNKLSPTIVCASARTLFSLVADPSPSTQTCCPAILVVVSISGIFPTFLRPPFNNHPQHSWHRNMSKHPTNEHHQQQQQQTDKRNGAVTLSFPSTKSSDMLLLPLLVMWWWLVENNSPDSYSDKLHRFRPFLANDGCCS